MVKAVVKQTDGTHIADLPRLIDYSWADTLSETGSGSVKVSLDDDRVTDDVIADGNIVELYNDGVLLFAFRIDPPTDFETIAVDDADRVLELSGLGILSILDDALVYPERGLEPFAPDDRPFNWISDDFRESPPADHPGETWSAPESWGTQNNPDNSEWEGFPENWPDILDGATWIWPTKPADLLAAPGDSYFRATFDLASDMDIGIYASADDEINLYVDGEEIVSTTGELQWQKTFVEKRMYGSGTHRIAVKGTNLERPSGNSAASVIWAIAELDSFGNPTSVIATSNTTDVTAIGYPDRAPGMTAGDKINILINEAQARGCFSNVTTSFDHVFATNGQSWTSDVDSRVRHLRSLLDVIMSMSDWQTDARMNPDQTLDLNGYNQHGDDLTTGNSPTEIRPGRDIKRMNHSRPFKLRNVLVGATEEGYIEKVDSTSVNDWGRRESAENLGETDETETGGDQLQAILDERKTQLLVAEAELVTNAHTLPYSDFVLGDIILAPNRKKNLVAHRVITIAAEMNDSGEPDWTIELEQQ